MTTLLSGSIQTKLFLSKTTRKNSEFQNLILKSFVHCYNSYFQNGNYKENYFRGIPLYKIKREIFF